jgi:hypothetical protein
MIIWVQGSKEPGFQVGLVPTTQYVVLRTGPINIRTSLGCVQAAPRPHRPLQPREWQQRPTSTADRKS